MQNKADLSSGIQENGDWFKKKYEWRLFFFFTLEMPVIIPIHWQLFFPLLFEASEILRCTEMT